MKKSVLPGEAQIQCIGKASQSSRPQVRKEFKSVFLGDMCVGENTTQAASVGACSPEGAKPCARQTAALWKKRQSHFFHRQKSVLPFGSTDFLSFCQTERVSAISRPGLCLVRKLTAHSPPKATIKRPLKSSSKAAPVHSVRSLGAQGQAVMRRRCS